MSLLEVSGLHVWFEPPNAAEVHAVQGVSFALDPGERFGLVGESGCGKTTTVLALMGLLPPNASAAGEVLIDGQNILAGGEESVQAYRWKDVAMVFQGAMNALNPVKKVGWQIAEPMAFHGVAQGAAARKRAGELLEMVGIPAAAGDRYPHEFSGGMRQRAAIAMALACEPKILLADEPTTALDVMVQAQILELLTGLARDLGLEDPTAVTWGTILENAFQRTAISSGAWWAIVPAGFAIAAVIVGCFLFGQAVEDALNPRLRVSYLAIRPWRLRPLVGRGPDAI